MYQPFWSLVESARNGREGLGWLVLGVFAVALFGPLAMTAFYVLAMQVFNFESLTNPDSALGTAPGEVIVLLLAFAGWAVVLGVVLRTFQKRHLTELLGPDLWPTFRRVLWALLLLNGAVLLLPPWDLMRDLSPGLMMSRWLMLLPLTLLAIGVQVTTEELLFRGYLQQYIAARFAHPAVWILVPSILFGLAHFGNATGGNAYAVVLITMLFGIAAADLTARTGSLGPAIAFHFANNFMAVAVISLSGEMSGLALYLLPFTIEDESAILSLLPVEIAMIGLSWLAARVALRR